MGLCSTLFRWLLVLFAGLLSACGDESAPPTTPEQKPPVVNVNFPTDILVRQQGPKLLTTFDASVNGGELGRLYLRVTGSITNNTERAVVVEAVTVSVRTGGPEQDLKNAYSLIPAMILSGQKVGVVIFTEDFEFAERIVYTVTVRTKTL